MNTAIRLERLDKWYGRGKNRVHAVKQNTLEIQAGQVYGFLGPNGAGKTTVIRLLLDLIHPTSGQAYLFDEPVHNNLAMLRRVGGMIETPSFYPFTSGRKNLEIIARTRGDYDSQRIDATLEQVGLADAKDKHFRGYSLGMKQRLALAAALLHDPQLLILDEPTNGLDPAGIQEMRHFIRELVDQHGKTVFLSSHLLNEVEQICDRVAIIHKGTIIREGNVRDLVGDSTTLKIDARPLDRITQALDGRFAFRVEDDRAMIDAKPEDAPALVRSLVEAGLEVYEVAPSKQSLEEFFLSVTQAPTMEDTTHELAHA